MSLTKQFNTRPLYQQVADEFISRIVSRRWAPGQSIENETEIARSLGISLGTVRKAFDILTEYQVLERQQGKGTVVADLESGPMRSRFSNIRDLDGRRISGEVTLHDVVLKTPTPEVAERMGVNERTPLLQFERRRAHMGRIFMVEDVYLRVGSAAHEMSPEALENLAAGRWYGHDLATHKSEWVSSQTATARDVEIFGISRLASILTLIRTICSYQDRVLEMRCGRCHLGTDLVYASR